MFQTQSVPKQNTSPLLLAWVSQHLTEWNFCWKYFTQQKTSNNIATKFNTKRQTYFCTLWLNRDRHVSPIARKSCYDAHGRSREMASPCDSGVQGFFFVPWRKLPVYRERSYFLTYCWTCVDLPSRIESPNSSSDSSRMTKSWIRVPVFCAASACDIEHVEILGRFLNWGWAQSYVYWRQTFYGDFLKKVHTPLIPVLILGLVFCVNAQEFLWNIVQCSRV